MPEGLAGHGMIQASETEIWIVGGIGDPSVGEICAEINSAHFASFTFRSFRLPGAQQHLHCDVPLGHSTGSPTASPNLLHVPGEDQ